MAVCSSLASSCKRGRGYKVGREMALVRVSLGGQLSPGGACGAHPQCNGGGRVGQSAQASVKL